MERYKKRQATPLHIVAKAGCDDVIKIFVEKGLDPNEKDTKLATPLHFAANAEIATTLLSLNAQPNAKDEGGFLPLHYAAPEQSDSTVRYNLFSDFFNYISPPADHIQDGTPCSLRARQAVNQQRLFCLNEIRSVAKQMLSEQIHDHSEYADYTPLHISACRGATELVKLLLRHRSPGHVIAVRWIRFVTLCGEVQSSRNCSEAFGLWSQTLRHRAK